MFNLNEAIAITKILMHFCCQKGINASMFYYFSSPGINAIYVLCEQNMHYKESIPEHIKASLCIHKQRAATIG